MTQIDADTEKKNPSSAFICVMCEQKTPAFLTGGHGGNGEKNSVLSVFCRSNGFSLFICVHLRDLRANAFPSWICCHETAAVALGASAAAGPLADKMAGQGGVTVGRTRRRRSGNFCASSPLWSQDLTAKLFCNVAFWMERLPKLIEPQQGFERPIALGRSLLPRPPPCD